MQLMNPGGTCHSPDNCIYCNIYLYNNGPHCSGIYDQVCQKQSDVMVKKITFSLKIDENKGR